MTRIPPRGTRYGFRLSRSQVLVYELVESLPTGAGARDDQRRGNGERSDSDRHTLRCVVCSGFSASEARAIGSVVHVEDGWFRRPDVRVLAEARGAA